MGQEGTEEKGSVEEIICQMIAEQVFKDAFEARMPFSCSGCMCRPMGEPTNWIGGFPSDVRKPPCYGKSRWQAVNRACGHYFEMEFVYRGGDGMDDK